MAFFQYYHVNICQLVFRCPVPGCVMGVLDVVHKRWIAIKLDNRCVHSLFDHIVHTYIPKSLPANCICTLRRPEEMLPYFMLIDTYIMYMYITAA